MSAVPTAVSSDLGESLNLPWRSRLVGQLFGVRRERAVAPSAMSSTPRAGRWPVLTALTRQPGAVVGLVLLLIAGSIALLADALFPGDPLAIVAEPLLRPGADAAYLLGTDALGRDIAAGLAHGARVSLLIGLIAAAVGVTIGTVLGALAGYFGGRTDRVISWLIEIFQTTPSFLLVVVVVAITGPSLLTIALVIGFTSWETVARIIRAEFRALLASDFVLAARSIGFGHRWIIFREILPNALPPIVISASVMVASAILMESSLAFLGAGDPNRISWGSMIGSGRDMLRSAAYLTTIPGLALVITVFSLNLIGDALVEAMNPRLRGRLTP